MSQGLGQGLRLSLSLGLGLGLGLAPSTAAAESGAQYKGWEVVSVQIQGLPKPLAEPLREGLALAGAGALSKKEKPRFYPNVLEDDLRRAALYLSRHGFPQASIVPRFKPQPKRERVGVILEVTPGPAVTVDGVDMDGWPDPVPRPDVAELSIRPQGRFTDAGLEETRTTLVAALEDAGHARAQVDPEVSRVDSSRAHVRLIVSPGPVYRFAEPELRGVPGDLVPLTRKTLAIHRGDPYSPAAMRQAQTDLRLLDLFRQVRLETSDGEADTLRLTADLVPRNPRTLEVSVGYWTDEQARIGARWQHRNLFLAGRGGEIHGAYSRFQQNLGTSAWWPALFGSRTRGVIGLDVEREREDSYTLVNTQIGLAVSYSPSTHTTLRTGIALSHVSLDVLSGDPGAFLEQGGWLTTLSSRWQRDTKDDPFYPTRGSATWLRGEWGPPGGISRAHFVLLEASAARYLPLGERTVMVGRVSPGWARPLAESLDLLPNKRFFAGGASSMRGFRRRKLGPLDAAGAPIGGEAKLEAGLEFRLPLFWLLRGALFSDAGQVWSSDAQVRLADLEIAVGGGVMLLTPIGPIRADVGHLLTEGIPGETDTVFHLTIGQPF